MCHFEVELREGHGADPVLAAEELGQRVLVDEGQLENDRGERLAGSLLLGDGLLEPLWGEQPSADEQMS